MPVLDPPDRRAGGSKREEEAPAVRQLLLFRFPLARGADERANAAVSQAINRADGA